MITKSCVERVVARARLSQAALSLSPTPRMRNRVRPEINYYRADPKILIKLLIEDQKKPPRQRDQELRKALIERVQAGEIAPDLVLDLLA